MAKKIQAIADALGAGPPGEDRRRTTTKARPQSRQAAQPSDQAGLDPPTEVPHEQGDRKTTDRACQTGKYARPPDQPDAIRRSIARRGVVAFSCHIAALSAFHARSARKARCAKARRMTLLDPTRKASNEANRCRRAERSESPVPGRSGSVRAASERRSFSPFTSVRGKLDGHPVDVSIHFAVTASRCPYESQRPAKKRVGAVSSPCW